jgi:hypothetical protein
MSNFFDAMYAPKTELRFLNPESVLDFTLCPSELLAWLEEKAGEISKEEKRGDYDRAVSSMCEYSCLWVCGKLKERYEGAKLKGKLSVYYGKFGFWEHYWIGYEIDGVEYYVDLTLAQFRRESPKLSVMVGEESKGVAEYNGCHKMSFKEFFGRLERDWNLIESGESKKMKDYFNGGMGNNVKDLMAKLENLDGNAEGFLL